MLVQYGVYAHVHYTGHIQGQEEGCVAMVKKKSKMQSCKETSDWLKGHAWDCDACCQLANGTQAEPGLLLRGVAWNRVSWVFSLAFSPAARSAFALIDSFSLSSPHPHRSLATFLSALLHVQKGERAHVEKFTEYFMQFVVWG